MYQLWKCTVTRLFIHIYWYLPMCVWKTSNRKRFGNLNIVLTTANIYFHPLPKVIDQFVCRQRHVISPLNVGVVKNIDAVLRSLQINFFI